MTARGFWGAEQAYSKTLQSAEPLLCQALSYKAALPCMLCNALIGGRTGEHFLLKAARGVDVGLVGPWVLVAIPCCKEYSFLPWQVWLNG